jgi:hypothetical protein
VIVMVSTSQWKGEVANQVKHRVAREYTLEYSKTTSHSEDGSADKAQYEHTEIKEGCYGE